MSLVIFDYTVLSATRHKWTDPTLNPARVWDSIYLPWRDGRLSWLLMCMMLIAVKSARLEAANEVGRSRRSKASSSSWLPTHSQQPRRQPTAEEQEQRRARVW